MRIISTSRLVLLTLAIFIFGTAGLANALSITGGPSVSNITESVAMFKWSLSEKATGQVEYGTSSAYGNFSKLEPSFNYSTHNQWVKNLAAGTLYHYRVISINSSGAQIVSSDKTFTTKGTATQPSYSYSYVVGSWSACSATTCGTNGTQTRSVVCTRNDGVAVADSYCTQTKPATSQACAAAACPVYTYSYVVGSWSACSASTCGTNGTQARSAVCTRNDGVAFADSYCSDAKPATSQACSAPACVPPPPPPPASDPGVPVGALNVKNYGATADDSSDDTAAIQKAINAVSSGGTVYVPAGKYMINAVTALLMKSNMKFQMDPAAILAVIPNDQKKYAVIRTNSASNLEIFGGTLLGDRNQHNYTLAGGTHEWGMGISVSGGSNVKIHDLTAKDLTGDGVCIGGYANGVIVDRILSTNNRRQGISITRSDNITVSNSELSYTNGTAPQYGIDIEPDPGVTDFHARGIIIKNNNIHHNAAGAICAYKQTFDITIADNIMAYNVYGIYTVQSFNGTVTGNLFAHNRFTGISFHGASDNWTVSNNVFRNNSTKALGITNDTNPLTSLTGLVNGTSTSIDMSSDNTNIHVLTNQYAK